MKKMNFNKSSKSGFTLIELLVVVAIIGILASIVLASLNSARVKASDTAIKANMANARAQAALFYDPAETYDGVCAATGTNVIGPILLNAAQKLNPLNTVSTLLTESYTWSLGDPDSSVCHSSVDGKSWAAITALANPSMTNGGWCVDNTGVSKEVSSLDAGVTACP